MFIASVLFLKKAATLVGLGLSVVWLNLSDLEIGKNFPMTIDVPSHFCPYKSSSYTGIVAQVGCNFNNRSSLQVSI